MQNSIGRFIRHHRFLLREKSNDSTQKNTPEAIVPVYDVGVETRDTPRDLYMFQFFFNQTTVRLNFDAVFQASNVRSLFQSFSEQVFLGNLE
jgi:hypothetical protein